MSNDMIEDVVILLADCEDGREELTQEVLEKHCELPHVKTYNMYAFCAGNEKTEKIILVFGSSDMNIFAINKALSQYLLGEETAYLDGALEDVSSKDIVMIMESTVVSEMVPVWCLFWDGQNLGGKA